MHLDDFDRPIGIERLQVTPFAFDDQSLERNLAPIIETYHNIFAMYRSNIRVHVDDVSVLVTRLHGFPLNLQGDCPGSARFGRRQPIFCVARLIVVYTLRECAGSNPRYERNESYLADSPGKSPIDSVPKLICQRLIQKCGYRDAKRLRYALQSCGLRINGSTKYPTDCRLRDA